MACLRDSGETMVFVAFIQLCGRPELAADGAIGLNFVDEDAEGVMRVDDGIVCDAGPDAAYEENDDGLAENDVEDATEESVEGIEAVTVTVTTGVAAGIVVVVVDDGRRVEISTSVVVLVLILVLVLVLVSISISVVVVVAVVIVTRSPLDEVLCEDS